MTPPTIVLHQWLISPFCAKVRKTLVAKQLGFEVRDYNGLLAAKAKRLSKAGKLPVLDYTGADGHTQRLQDSAVIVRFLERAHPEPSLWPREARDRHLAHVLEDWADEALFWLEAHFRLMDPVASRKAGAYLGAGRPTWERIVIETAGKLTYKRKLDAVGLGGRGEAQLEAMVREHLHAVEGLLEGREWLLGDRQSIADIAVAAQLGEFLRTSRFASEIQASTHLHAWLERNPG